MDVYEFQTLKDLVESKGIKKKLGLKKSCKEHSVKEIILRTNNPMVRRLRMIEEEEGNLDQQFELPPDFDANKELLNIKAKFMGTCRTA